MRSITYSLVVLLVIGILVLSSWYDIRCAACEIVECVSAIADVDLKNRQVEKYGPYDQYLFDNSPYLKIYGSGFDILKDRRLSIKLSGHAIQSRDFEVSVTSSTVVLKLIGNSR
jgi:hypothetical protein